MEIDNKLIEHLCFLSRLSLSPDESERLKGDLARILAYVEAVKQVDVSGVEPLVHSGSSGQAGSSGIFRDDRASENPPGQSRALENAPQPKAGFFQVPRIIE